MKRGDIVLVADRSGDFSGKPRPGLIVQSDAYNDTHRSVSICPITSGLIDAVFFRIPLAPNVDNGLQRRSDVEVDKLQAVKRSRIGETIGRITDGELTMVDTALRRWLSL